MEKLKLASLGGLGQMRCKTTSPGFMNYSTAMAFLTTLKRLRPFEGTQINIEIDSMTFPLK